MTYRALRRTFATQFQRHGSPKGCPGSVRHSKLEMTDWYMRDIPQSVRTAVEEMDAEISFKRSCGTPGPIRTADLLLRRQTLYPAELRAHFLCASLLSQCTKRTQQDSICEDSPLALCALLAASYAIPRWYILIEE